MHDFTLSIVQEAGSGPGLVWTDAENLAPSRIRSLDVQPIANRYTDYAIPAHTTYFLHLVSPYIFIVSFRFFFLVNSSVAEKNISNKYCRCK